MAGLAAVTETAADRWVCCQLRAREHFMVPVGLVRQQALSRVITDIWVSPGSVSAAVFRRLRPVYHPELDGRVSAFTTATLLFEATQALAGTRGWDRMMRRNEWFQDRALTVLKRSSLDANVLCSYSYTARRLFQHAKTAGWKTVLVQIDPGIGEERLVAAAHARNPGLEANWQPAPAEYWARWRDELALADRIIVHSPWSRDALIAEGVGAEKLIVVPLAYEPPRDAASFARVYPDRFTIERPLRVLYLGQVNLRKGALALLDAARELRNDPVEFVVAGPSAMDLSSRAADGSRIRWMGSVPRGETAAVYRSADVFVLPTLSDGFGLAQLEAQAWQLPLITTANCGAVVRDGINGTLLREGSGIEIAAVLRRMIARPAILAEMSREARIADQYHPDRFATALRKSLQ
jgi:glycosyltransferase involved in cell wall biosynthesis